MRIVFGKGIEKRFLHVGKERLLHVGDAAFVLFFFALLFYRNIAGRLPLGTDEHVRDGDVFRVEFAAQQFGQIEIERDFPDLKDVFHHIVFVCLLQIFYRKLCAEYLKIEVADVGFRLESALHSRDDRALYDDVFKHTDNDADGDYGTDEGSKRNKLDAEFLLPYFFCDSFKADKIRFDDFRIFRNAHAARFIRIGGKIIINKFFIRRYVYFFQYFLFELLLRIRFF